jgi:hypothetical protein
MVPEKCPGIRQPQPVDEEKGKSGAVAKKDN